jgi:soluble lytic murein transglycosylase-like protein
VLLRLQFRNRRRSLSRRLALALSLSLSTALAAEEATPPGGPIVSGADANVCAALAAEAGRLASKYTLGQRGCEAPAAATAAPRAAAQRSPLPRTHQAQQLYLYENPSEAARTTLMPSSALPGPVVPLRRQPLATPTRTLSKAPVERALRLAPAVDAAARAHDIDPLLLHAIARVESRHDAQAVSPAGALGVMQVMPATARRFGVAQAQSLHHAPTNLEVSAAYLKTLQQRFGNQLPLVLAAYNAGEGAVERHGRRIPPYVETQRYVRDVIAEYARLRAALPRAAIDAKGLL